MVGRIFGLQLPGTRVRNNAAIPHARHPGQQGPVQADDGARTFTVEVNAKVVQGALSMWSPEVGIAMPALPAGWTSADVVEALPSRAAVVGAILTSLYNAVAEVKIIDDLGNTAFINVHDLPPR